MTRTMWGAALGVLALAAPAAGQTSGDQVCMEPCQLCMQKIQGNASGGVYENACAQCDRERAQARQRGQQAQGASAPTASRGSTSTSPGADVRASLDQVGRNLSQAVSGSTGDARRNMDQLAAQRGFGAGGTRLNTLITDVVGTFTGEGLNVEYQRPIADRISGVAGANYSRTSSTTGSLTAFGVAAGADFFPFTYAGQGLRVGPRLQLDFGQESVDHTRYFTDVGLGGEIGYNWQLSSGLALQLAGGLGGRIGGALTSGLDTRLGGDFGPYGKINVGWSW